MKELILKFAASLPAPIESEARAMTVSRWLRALMAGGAPPLAVDDILIIAAHRQSRKSVCEALLRAINPELKYDAALASSLAGKAISGRGRPSTAGKVDVAICVSAKVQPGQDPDKVSAGVRISLPRGKRGVILRWLNDGSFVGVVHSDNESATGALKGDAIRAAEDCEKLATRLTAPKIAAVVVPESEAKPKAVKKA